MNNVSNSYQKFIILTMPRSGSNYLSYLLHDHPNIISIGELFCIETLWGQPGKKNLNHNFLLKFFRNLFPILFLKKYIYHEYPNNIQAVGFRFFYHQVDRFKTVFKYLFSLKGIKIIHLKRMNLLDNLISLKLARKTRIWSSLVKPRKKIIKINLDYNECLEYFKNATFIRNKYDGLLKNKSCIDVHYEQLIKNTQKEISKLLNFLNIPNIPKKSLNCSLIKQNLYKPQEVVTNYKQLKNQFKNSQWSKFFI